MSAYARATLSSCSMPDITGISVGLPVLSTAILPDALLKGSGHATGMDLNILLANIERRLTIMKMSADKASKAAGHPDCIRNLKRRIKGEIKGDGISHQIVRDLARVLETTAEQLTEPREKVEVQPIPGLRGQLLSQLQYLERERERVIEQLEALDAAELTAQKPQRRKIR
jgi:hypothetical protein